MTREVVTAEQMDAVIRDYFLADRGERPRPARPPAPHAPATGSTAYGRAALDRECGEVVGAPSGDRNNTLNKAAWRLGQLVGGGELAHAEVESALWNAVSVHREADDGRGWESKQRGTIRRGIEAGMTTPRSRPAAAPKATAAFVGGGAPSPDPGGEAAAEPPKEHKYKLIDHAEFRTKDFRVEWLVEWFLAAKQPAVVAGPSKGMKTSVLVDLALSLATATPHLGKWPVKRRVRAAIVSGESGGFTLQETARRVLAAKGLAEDAPDDWLKWEFTLPTFADLIDTADFADRLGGLGCEVVIIDPFYLCLGDVDAKNMFEMGRALRAVAELLIARHGVTPVIAHHANRLLPVGEPMELQHLAYSGLEQFARQYVFINRRERYSNDGRHELWYRYGGSAGHSGLYRVGIDEGVLGPDTPVRRWDVEVTTPTETRARDAEATRETKRADVVTQSQLDEREVMEAIDAECQAQPGASKSRIRALTINPNRTSGLSDDRVRNAIQRLLDAKVIEKFEYRKGGGNTSAQPVTAYRRPDEDDG